MRSLLNVLMHECSSCCCAYTYKHNVDDYFTYVRVKYVSPLHSCSKNTYYPKRYIDNESVTLILYKHFNIHIHIYIHTYIYVYTHIYIYISSCCMRLLN